MILSIGNLVTIENPTNGEPYKKRFGLLTEIQDLENHTSLNDISSTDPNFIYCRCKIDWLTGHLYVGDDFQNATYVREFNFNV